MGKFSEEPGHRESAGTIDYLIFTRFISRPGWLIYSFLYTFISMKNKKIFNIKCLKSFRSSLRKKATSAEAALWDILKSKNPDRRKFRRQYSIGSYIVDFCSDKLINHPGRYRALLYFDYYCTAATPPLKGGETSSNLSIYNTTLS